MSVAGISSSNFMSQNIASSQNQQQLIQQQFQALAQEFQSGSLSPAQTTALQRNGVPTSGTLPTTAGTLPTDPTSTQAPGSSSHAHNCYRMHINTGDDSDNGSGQTSLGQLGQAVQASNTSSAQQAYGGLTQDLQQIALNSDLLTAQTAVLQASALSVSA